MQDRKEVKETKGKRKRETRKREYEEGKEKKR